MRIGVYHTAAAMFEKQSNPTKATDPPGITDMQFRSSWRDYQQRVLSELEDHLDDDHLHVVAAPGSGKTVLGLEVVRRLARPALVLAPTITIRNQWVERLVELFLPDGEAVPDWVSKDIRRPAVLTVVTYQALNAASAGEPADEDLIDPEEEEGDTAADAGSRPALDVPSLLAEIGVRTLVLDEAHHLRREWWKSVTQTKAGLNQPFVVSLTATPPYDVDHGEWERYEALCGPIDTEISVPELVLQGDLCPHQDFVHFSLPTAVEAEKLAQIKSGLADFVANLSRHPAFLAALAEHPWTRDPGGNIEAILDDPAFFSSILIFLHHAGRFVPREALDVLGVGGADIPPLDAERLQTLLTGVFFRYAEDFAAIAEPVADLRRDLHRLGAIDRRRVVIDDTKAMQKLLASSVSKLHGIREIAGMEWSVLGGGLRMVVLADFIRRSELPGGRDDQRPLNKIGVVPIFECLRRTGAHGPKLGILTGSLVVVRDDCLPLVRTVADEMGLDDTHLRHVPMPHDDTYVRLEISGESRQRIVHLITEVFSRGGINILVGTQALLGEGWDAPSINSLVLASYVGSYMLSNQMRGRAIRIDPDNPGKTATIWHLVAVDIESVKEKLRFLLTGVSDRRRHFDPFDEIKEDLGHDLRLLRRRFRAFEGLSFTDPAVIENGFKRMALSGVQWTDAGVRALSRVMLERASRRSRLPVIWRNALQGSSPKPEMREQVESNSAPRGLTLADTLKNLVVQALAAGVFFGTWLLEIVGSGRINTVVVAFAFMVWLALTAPKLLKALYLLLRNGSLEGSVKQVGWAVLETLEFMEVVKTTRKALKIKTATDKAGVVHCRLDGATSVERQRFLDAMQQILGPVDNPRYLLVRRSRLGPLLRIDYHAVPDLIGQNKKTATYFAKRWNRYVGPSSLVYTRTVEGRLALLQARTRALSAAFRKRTDRISVWE